jgi:DNA topoisomerase-1
VSAPRKPAANHRAVGALDPFAAAKLARLHHTLDDRPGITRHKAPNQKAWNGFDYRDPDGSLVRDIETLRRIRSLVVPPAWSAVWINPDPHGHIQATGRDQRGRKQYRYHPRWREVRDESKYGKTLNFARVLPLIRARIDADLRRRGLPRERVLAAIVRIMEQTLFRVGNSEYAKVNKSFGLTTLRDRHADIRGSTTHEALLTLYRQRFGQQIETAETAAILANWEQG